VLVRPTSFRPLEADENRNRLICEDVLKVVREGRSPVVLTERTDHLRRLAEQLAPAIPHLIVLQGKMGRKKLKATLAQLAGVPENEGRVLLATGRYLGKGFDDARLDTLFLTLPISWRGTIAQYAGRLHRLHDRKREVRVYDYADLNIPMLARMFDRRCQGYEAIGYSILLPASAVPGWPAEVPLPIEPE
jgi:superfamily II DNA or RNA helicase